MPAALVPLEAIQFGIETTPGTLVAADTQLQLEDGGEFGPEIERPEVPEEHGVLAPAQHIDTRKGTVLRYRHVLDFEQIILALQCGIKQAAASPGTGAPETWTYDPDPSAPEALDAATFEASYTDGTTRHLEEEVGFATCRRMLFGAQFNQLAQFEAEWFARAAQDSTYTAAQAPLSRELIRANSFGLYIDPTWAGLGTTQLTGLLRSWSLEILTGVGPDYTQDARPDLDMTQIMRGKMTARLTMTLEYDANGDAEYDAWKANTRRFISFQATGTSSRSLKLQGAFEYTSNPRFRREGDLRLVDVEAAGIYDATGGQMLNIEVVNALSAI